MTATDTASHEGREFSTDEWDRGRTTPALKSATDDCWDHAHELPCPTCAADDLWLARMREAEQWGHAAELAEAVIVNDPIDQEHVKAWVAYCRRQETRLRAWLQATANAEPER
jgi:hypothetical protein